MRSDHLTQIQADVLTFLHQNKRQTVTQLYRALNLERHVGRSILIKLVNKRLIRIEQRQIEGGFMDGKKQEILHAVGNPESVFGMYLKGHLDKPIAPKIESTYAWMKRQFGKRRTVELLKAAGAWKPSPKTAARAS